MKNVGAYYTPYIKPPNCCEECDPKRYFDPYSLWDQFPCPPPWNRALFLKLPWKERLGDEDGEQISARVASRCGIDVEQLRALPGTAASSLLVNDCDLSCFLLIAAFICIFLVAFVAAFVIKRKGLHVWKRKTVRNNISSNQAPYTTQYGFPSQKQTEAILADGDVQTRLLNLEYNQSPKPFQLGQYTTESPRENMYDTGFKKPKLTSEDTSAFYSGTDTTHTYDSLHGSSRSNSVRLSDTIQRRFVPLTDTYHPNDNFENASFNCPCEKCCQMREIYSAMSRNNSPRGSVGQCSCNRCSNNRLYQSEIYYGNDSNPYFESPEVASVDRRTGIVSDTEALQKHNKKRKKRKNKDSKNKSENSISKAHSQELYSRPDDSYNVGKHGNIQICMCQKCVQIRENFDRTYRQQSMYATGQPVHRCRCQCSRCSQMNEVVSDGYTTNRNLIHSDGSDVYGIPDRVQNVHQCRQCSQSNLNPQIYQPQQNIETPTPTTDTFPLKAFVPQDEVNVDNTDIDHRKRRRSRPSSVIASTSDTNSGSEKSYRIGVPRTNGSLYRTKFMYR